MEEKDISGKRILQSYESSFLILNYFIKVVFLSVYDESIAIGDKNGIASIVPFLHPERQYHEQFI